MFAVVQCSVCRRARVVDLSKKTSTCTWCNTTDSVLNLRIIAKSRTEAKAKENLTQMTTGTLMIGFDGQPMDGKPKHAKRSTDPWSSLEYEYEQAKGLESKIFVIVKYLPGACGGDFTEEDLLKLDPKNGSKLLELMLERCDVHETSFGHYKP